MDIVKYLGVIGIVLMVVEYATPIKVLKVHFKVDEDAKLKDNQLVRKIIQGLLGCSLCLPLPLVFHCSYFVLAR